LLQTLQSSTKAMLLVSGEACPAARRRLSRKRAPQASRAQVS
jgi:hypothetical protein